MRSGEESSGAPDFEVGPLQELARVLAASNVLILAQSYHASVSACLDQLEAAERDGDWSTIREQAHDLKGVAGTFGALRLQELAGQLEVMADEENAQSIAPILDAMRRTSETAKAAIEKILESQGTIEKRAAQAGR
jgi:HPt (histidine-containing phosphotransfer) domain-containing protein